MLQMSFRRLSTWFAHDREQKALDEKSPLIAPTCRLMHANVLAQKSRRTSHGLLDLLMGEFVLASANPLLPDDQGVLVEHSFTFTYPTPFLTTPVLSLALSEADEDRLDATQLTLSEVTPKGFTLSFILPAARAGRSLAISWRAKGHLKPQEQGALRLLS